MKAQRLMQMLLAVGAVAVASEQDDFRTMQVVVEAAQEVSHRLTYTNESTNFETGQYEDNYFQPPLVTERIRRGDCKDYAIYLEYLVCERCSSNGIDPNFYIVFGHVDGHGHAWNYLVLGTNEFYMVSGIRGLVIPVNEISDKLWSPARGLWTEEYRKFEELKKKPCGARIKYNYDVPKEWFFDFGRTNTF